MVDDGSTDDSLAQLSALQDDIEILRVITHDTNRGAIAAMNTGLDAASGDYVYFGAADDQALPFLFADGVDMLARFPQAALSCAECVVYEAALNRKSLRPPVRPLLRSGYFSILETQAAFKRADNFILSGTALVRTHLLKQFGGFDAQLGSFADGFVMRHLSFAHGFCYISKISHIWNVSPEGYSRSSIADGMRSQQMLEHAQRKILQTEAIPDWYARRLQKKWTFNAAWLCVHQRSIDWSCLKEAYRNARSMMFVLNMLQTFKESALVRWILKAVLLLAAPYRLSDLAYEWMIRHRKRQLPQ